MSDICPVASAKWQLGILLGYTPINGTLEGIHCQKHIDHARIGDRHVSATISLSKRELVFYTLLPKIPYCYKTQFLGSGIYIPTRA